MAAPRGLNGNDKRALEYRIGIEEKCESTQSRRERSKEKIKVIGFFSNELKTVETV